MATWQDYLREARRFWEVAQAVDGPGYRNQAVSNAVHAVIAANDAFCLFHIGRRPEGDSHAEAGRVLRRACKGTNLDDEAPRRAQQLADVLEQKSPSQYYGKQLSSEAAERVMKQAERFISWVRETLPQSEAKPPEDE